MSTGLQDLRIAWKLACSPIRGDTHHERLESFYGHQADGYDSFRSKLLHGRQELIESLEFPDDGVWVDLGAGTGENVLHAGSSRDRLAEIRLVDLSPSLLAVANQRIIDNGWTNVTTAHADATSSLLPNASVDVVTLSYSLTMIPDWFAAITKAYEMLKPGGVIGVADFFVSRKFACFGQTQHGWLRRTFWTQWFAMDNVFLDGNHIAMLHRTFDVESFSCHEGTVPYLPRLRAPYYRFIGRKKQRERSLSDA